MLLEKTNISRLPQSNHSHFKMFNSFRTSECYSFMLPIFIIHYNFSRNDIFRIDLVSAGASASKDSSAKVRRRFIHKHLQDGWLSVPSGFVVLSVPQGLLRVTVTPVWALTVPVLAGVYLRGWMSSRMISKARLGRFPAAFLDFECR